MNFELLENTVATLAKFFQIEEISTGVERLMRLLYKIKSKIEKSWVDILNLRAVMVIFSIHKDFYLKYRKESLSFYVCSQHDIVIQPRERLLNFYRSYGNIWQAIVVFQSFRRK